MLFSKLVYKNAKVAIGELAQNPEIESKAAKVVKESVGPCVNAGWERAKPKI